MDKFVEQIEGMSISELKSYDVTVKIVDILLTACGVGVILLALILSSWVITGLGVIALYYIGNMSVAAGIVREVIQTRMAYLAASDK